MTTPDGELLRRYADTNAQDAFADLLHRHLNLVYFAALRQVRDPHLAEDVSQAVFADLARKARPLSRRPNLASWLHTSTRYAAAKTLRSESRRQRREQLAMNSIEDPATEWERLKPAIDELLDQLPEADREAVLLRFFEGRSFNEIAASLNVSADAARMRLERALKRLHEMLRRRGMCSMTAALGAILETQAGAAAPAPLAGTISATIASTGGVGGMAVAGWLSSASLAKSGLALGWLTVAVTAGFGFHELNRAREGEAALHQDRREVFALARRVEAQKAQMPRVDAKGRRGAMVAVEKEASGPFGPAPAGSRARGRALMAAYPEIRDLLVQDRRAFFAAEYGKLYEEIGLTPAQIDAFEGVMIAGVSSTYGQGDRTVTLEAAPPMSWHDKELRIREILGPVGFERFEAYQRDPRASRAADLAALLCWSETPLTTQQAAQLKQVLQECGSASGRQSPAEYWSAVRRKAEPFLAPPQIAALDNFQAMDDFNYARQLNQQSGQATGSKGAAP